MPHVDPPNPKFARRIMTPVLTLLLTLSAISSAFAAPPEFDPLLPAFQDVHAEQFEGQLIDYDINITFRPEVNRITGSMTVTFPNFTDESLDEIAFRLFPNAVYYGEGYLYIISLKVDGEPIEPRFDDTRTALFVPLTQPLEPNDTVVIELAFRTVIPENSRGTYGVFSHHLGTGAWVLADWHPIVAGWDADLGWRTDAPTSLGDPTFADIGLYDLTVTLPAGFNLIATGIEQTEPIADGEQRVSVVTGPARDLTLLISDDLVPLEGASGETTVRVWAGSAPESQAAAEWVLTESIAALAAWGERYGLYPASQLDLVATPIQQAVLGVSWTGLIMLSDALLLLDTSWIESDPTTARFAIVHEIGHQWWGNMIGANSNDHPFMVEGLTNALSIDIAHDLYGRDVALSMLEAQMAGRYRQALIRSGDDVVDQPTGLERANGPGRAALAYGKGALGFLAIRLEMGEEAWFAAMIEFGKGYLYANAEPEDLLAVLIEHAPPGAEVAAVWDHWFHGESLTVEEIDAVVAGIAARLGPAT